VTDANPVVSDVARLANELQQYFDQRLQYPSRICNLTCLAGGASHATWAFDLTHLNGDEHIEPLVLRKEFTHGLLATDLKREYELLSYLSARDFPVPAPKCYEFGSALATPFIVMARIDGRDIRKVLADTAQRAARESLGQDLIRLQARLHQTAVDEALMQILDSAAPATAKTEIERWAVMVARYQTFAYPLLAAAMNWLRTNLPTIDKPVLVHGDYKTNNLLFSATGPVVIDWEMAHLGDAYEDLAWTLLWTTKFDLAQGLLTEEQYLNAYAEESGVAVDRARLFFWRIFSLLKLAAIFLSGGAQGIASEPRPQLAMLGRALPWIENRLSILLRETLRKDCAA
jgi:aminoglycoside phosphotransferase (APT) family kinase protein